MNPIQSAFSRVDTLLIDIGPSTLLSPTYELEVELATDWWGDVQYLHIPSRTPRADSLFASLVQHVLNMSSVVPVEDPVHSSLQDNLVRALTQSYPKFLLTRVSAVQFQYYPDLGFMVRCS